MAAARNKIHISIIIPTLNEEKNVGQLLLGIKKILKNKSYEILVVDGHSDDNTVGIARKQGAEILYDNVGKGSALIKGLKEARGTIVITMDADLSHDPKELLPLIDNIEGGYDVCMGSRFIKGGRTEDMSVLRLLGNKFFLTLVNIRFGSHYTDICYGYRSFRKGIINGLDLKETGFGIETEINIKAVKNNLKLIEIPSTEWKRNAGNSKLRTFRDGYLIFKTIVKNAF